jgi:hypothetical protein
MSRNDFDFFPTFVQLSDMFGSLPVSMTPMKQALQVSLIYRWEFLTGANDTCIACLYSFRALHSVNYTSEEFLNGVNSTAKAVLYQCQQHRLVLTLQCQWHWQNLSLIRYQTYQTLNLSDIEPFRYWTYLIPNLSGTKPIWYWTQMISKLLDNQPIRYWTLLSLSAIKQIHTYMFIIVC